jgi:hypothetical protein
MKDKPIKFKNSDLMWLNIWDLKMPKTLASQFILKYIGPYKMCYIFHPNVFTLLLPTTFMTHLTFHVFKSLNENERRLDRKQAYHSSFDSLNIGLQKKLNALWM